MKFIQSSLAKKLIIILIVLLLFNVAYPSMSYAWDIGGILLSPIYIAIASVCLVTDLGFGFTLFQQEFFGNTIDGIVENILYDGEPDGEQDFYGKELADWFVGPDTIFMGRIPSLNANIFDHLDRTEDDILKDVSEAVAKFYVILRNIAAMIMLAGLIYTGIQILLSSNIPTKKTQYLMLLQDWIIGMALLIFSHIIMIFILHMAETITLYLSKTLGAESLKWELIKKMAGSFESTTQLISFLLYGWLQFLTIVFAISYFKRYFWTCILIVFAPVFCVMYAFGQQTKQIYSNWLKEFFLNAFVQPFHIVVYTVLVAFPLAITSDTGGGFIQSFNFSFQNGPKLVYALMGMSMIRPAEKYLRRLFNMDKGIANMASYDSGMQSVKAIGKAVAKVAGTIASIYTGGAFSMAQKGMQAAQKGQALNKADKGGGMGLDAGNDPSSMMQQNGMDSLNGAYDSSSSMSLGWGPEQSGNYLDTYNDDYMNSKELGAGQDQDDFSEGDVKALTEGIKQANEDSINAANITINAGSVSLAGGEQTTENAEIKQIDAEGADISTDESKESKEIDGKLDVEIPELSSGEIFKNLGGLEQLGTIGVELFEGLSSITDGLYVDGTAPTSEWRNDAQWMRGNIKEAGEIRQKKLQQTKTAWATSGDNIAYMADQYMPKMREIYKGKSEAYIRDKAEEKAKSELVKMSEYVTYGITNVSQVHKLYNEQKKNGFTVEQTVKNEAGYAKFNSNPANVTQINQSGAYTQNNYTTVEAAIPDAKTYYNAGYTNINEMAFVDKIAQSLGQTPAFAMKVDQALKKKGGKITYTGKNEEMKKLVQDINSTNGG